MDKEKLKALGLDEGKADEVLKLFGADEAKRQEADRAAALEREQLKESVKNYEAQLATLKTNSGDAEALRAQIAQLEADNKAKAGEYQKSLEAQRVQAAVRLALLSREHRPHDAEIVAGLIDLDKIEWAPMPIEKSGQKYIIRITNPAEYAAYVEFGYMQRPGMILKMKEVKGKLRFVKFLGYSAKYGLGDPKGKAKPDEDGNIVIITRKRFIKGRFMARDALDVMKKKWSNNYKRRILKAMQEAFK